MAIVSKITITSQRETDLDLDAALLAPQGQPGLQIQKLQRFLDSMAGGVRAGAIDVQVDDGDAVAATGTITLSSLANNDTVTVGGIVFTAKTSGASGQAQFNLGANDTAAAVALAAAISAHTSLTGVLAATSALGVVTVTAAIKGKAGNMAGLAISAHGSVSGSTLASGANATANSFSYGV